MNCSVQKDPRSLSCVIFLYRILFDLLPSELFGELDALQLFLVVAEGTGIGACFIASSLTMLSNPLIVVISTDTVYHASGG